MGSLKTLPYLVMFLMSNVGGWGGDWLILTHKYSVGSARKTINTIGVCWWGGEGRGRAQDHEHNADVLT